MSSWAHLKSTTCDEISKKRKCLTNEAIDFDKFLQHHFDNNLLYNVEEGSKKLVIQNKQNIFSL